MSVWIVIVSVAAATFLLRASFLLFANPHRFPHAFRQALTFVPPAVLAAIVAPGLAMPEGVFDWTLANPRWIAGLVALAVAYRFRNPLAPVAAGLPALWLLQWAMR
jgi:branched-subunit amino acid transport protein